jgi:ATP-binding cassette, sub-family E, member 1
VELIVKSVKGNVGEILKNRDERGVLDGLVRDLELDVLDRQVDSLSGGELQRFAIAAICCIKADVYMFDEPSSYFGCQAEISGRNGH